jgi:hypothetical protein
LLKVEDQKVEIVNRDYFVNGSTYLFIIKIFKKRFVIKKLNILEIHQGQKKKIIVKNYLIAWADLDYIIGVLFKR